MQQLTDFLSAASTFLSGTPLLFLLVGTGSQPDRLGSSLRRDCYRNEEILAQAVSDRLGRISRNAHITAANQIIRHAGD